MASGARATILAAAIARVHRAGGLTVAVDRLSLEEVAREASLSRATAYRIWPSKELFHRDVLAELARPVEHPSHAVDREARAVAQAILADRLDELDTPQGRRDLLESIINAAVTANFRHLHGSGEWHSHLALIATLPSVGDAEVRHAIGTRLRDAEDDFTEAMAQFLERISTVLGLRLRPGPWTFATIATLGAAMVEGLALRTRTHPERAAASLEVDGPAGPREWSLASFAYATLVERMIEPVPDYDARTAVAGYLAATAETR